MDDLTFLPPQNIEAEQQVLGALFIANEEIRKLDIIPADFYKPSHGKIFKAMGTLSDKQEPLDFVTVSNQLTATGDLELVGGTSYLTALVSCTPTSANIHYHARMIKDASQRRQLIRICQDVFQGISERSLDETLSFLRNETRAIVRGTGANIMSYKQLMKITSEFIEERYNSQGKLSGIPSGFIDIDDLTDGWQKADLIILGARPSMGKSALSQVFVENAEVPAGIIQIEMGEIQTGIRSISRDSSVPLWKLRKGNLAKSDWHTLTQSIINLAAKEVYVDFASRRLSDIEKTFTKMVEVHNVQFVVVDYLQLADTDVKNDSRAREVAETSKLLKHMAKSHRIPVMALAQLNRAVENRQLKKPTLADLKESGQIEQDADMVIFLYEDANKPGVAILDFAKGRNIGLGEVYLTFDKKTMTFRNCNTTGGRS